jgi:hypothetical protein
MDDAVCEDCKTLQQAALRAIIRHHYARRQLALAKLQHDRLRIRVLGAVVERLLQVRIAAVRAYQEHLDAHAKAASAGTG